MVVESWKVTKNKSVFYSSVVENVKDVYSVQQLKQLMAELENTSQQIPTFGIVYACLTSFDIDSDVKQVIASRWLVQ